MTKHIDISDISFHQLPEDGGQIVDITYGRDEAYLYCHTHDRSDSSHTYSRAKILARNRTEFEPQNGLLPEHGVWREITVAE